MNKVDEILLEIEGKTAYADATGNAEAKKELCEITAVLKKFKQDRDKKCIHETQNLTLNRAVKAHRTLWKAIAVKVQNGELNCELDDLKVTVLLELMEPYRKLRNDCFLCQYAAEERERQNSSNMRCDFCPLNNPDWNNPNCLNGLYNEFFHMLENEDYDKAAAIAIEIAELPIVSRNYLKL